MVVFCKNCWHNVTSRIPSTISFRFPQFYLYSCVCEWVCGLWVFSFMKFHHTCGFLDPLPQSGHDTFPSPQGSLIITPPFPHFFPVPTSCHSLICFHFVNIYHFKMLYKWTHRVCYFWGLAFSYWALLYIYIATFVSPFICWRTFGLPLLLLLWIKLLCIFMYRFFCVCEYKLSIFCDKCPTVWLLACVVIACLVW